MKDHPCEEKKNGKREGRKIVEKGMQKRRKNGMKKE
jgi:hypothetical protein